MRHALSMGHWKARYGLAPASASSRFYVIHKRVAAVERGWMCQLVGVSRIH